MIAQKLGLTVDEIAESRCRLPQRRTPNAQDWARISHEVRHRITNQIVRSNASAPISTAASTAAA